MVRPRPGGGIWSVGGDAAHCQVQEDFFEGHVHVFRTLGGVSRSKVRYDNLKSGTPALIANPHRRAHCHRHQAAYLLVPGWFLRSCDVDTRRSAAPSSCQHVRSCNSAE